MEQKYKPICLKNIQEKCNHYLHQIISQDEFKQIEIKGKVVEKETNENRYDLCFGRIKEDNFYLRIMFDKKIPIEIGDEGKFRGYLQHRFFKTKTEGYFRLKVEEFIKEKQESKNEIYEEFAEELILKEYFATKKTFPELKDKILKIAIVSSIGKRGYNDAIKVLEEKKQHFKIYSIDCNLHEKTAIVQAIQEAEELNVNLILLVRGGGDVSEFEVFNSDEITHKIQTSSIFILTGLGHKDNQTLADASADHSEINPSEAARFIIKEIEKQLERIRSLEELQSFHDFLNREMFEEENK